MNNLQRASDSMYEAYQEAITKCGYLVVIGNMIDEETRLEAIGYRSEWKSLLSDSRKVGEVRCS